MITQIAFYLFAAILVVSGVMVVSARNPVHAVLFLILAFFNAAGLFLIAGAEFLAMILVIVYVGAVAVLFLFVVMMLDVNFNQLREGLQRYTPVGAAVGVALFAELVFTIGGWKVIPAMHPVASGPGPAISNTEALGRLIYTDYVFLFQACGLVLLVAMIGAIVLTLRERPSARRQDVTLQHLRTPADTLEMMSLSIGDGVRDSGGFLRPHDGYGAVAAHGRGTAPEDHQADHHHGA
ncbi:NADH-quinone oxidoreductase subunit J [Lichenicola cladoniae]|uniref:NADH-quinone oxidoreductase subunit J n=1 Tax=Lichenicola cladoniae TaxID=1484109 RepID=A0A6M8HQG8_9PROT|nr:NADH-quinone oxidoreductase subunit J [Lichenicola cladoniae]NPD67918.1 NADH-quinone oxidoreductase subunit J [Acetobacteraceae bacterium]QKE90515.1 NADH-quinone oxidoreductase subunit J [Lichenicola cladoniae]